MADINKKYKKWLAEATYDEDLRPELEAMAGDPDKQEDAFYRDLAFGTGGLRGTIGAGTNRMNVYTVARATRGIANYLHEEFGGGKVAIGFDSRIKSTYFAQVAAGVLAAQGLEVYIYPELLPTPCLSFAVRELGCQAGLMITASHNPAAYNGYKVYGPDGCQITTEAAARILAEIDELDYFDGFAVDPDSDLIHTIEPEVLTHYIEEVKKQSIIGDEVPKDISIVYSPLHGAGLVPVVRTLLESGYTQIEVVPEQAEPDGNFTTCPEPNPEYAKTLKLGIDLALAKASDLVIATDPDCDRVGIAVRNGDEFTLLSGNQVGVLLLDFLCSQKKLPERPVAVKTIVTSDMASSVAEAYGVELRDVLTGFKFIGEQIGLLEAEGRVDDFIFGFEESYGYLAGSYVRDKDAVVASLLICEMFAYYRSKGVSLPEKMDELYARHGYWLDTLYSFKFPGSEGFREMQEIMKSVRTESPFEGAKVLDYLQGLEGLPSSDVIKFVLDGGSSVVMRPSGTEPKLKAYISVSAADEAEARAIEAQLHSVVKEIVG